MAHIIGDEQADRPHVRIETHGERWLTRVFIDGVQQRYVTRVRFDTGEPHSRGTDTLLEITMFADIELVGDEDQKVTLKEEPAPWRAASISSRD